MQKAGFLKTWLISYTHTSDKAIQCFSFGQKFLIDLSYLTARFRKVQFYTKKNEHLGFHVTLSSHMVVDANAE